MDKKDFIQAIDPVQDIQNETGRKIRRLRMHRQIPAKVLGKPYHISEASMLQYELGIRSVSEEKLRNIAHALGTRPSVLRPRHLAGIDDAMQVLFELAAAFGLEPVQVDGHTMLSAKGETSNFVNLEKYLAEWAVQHQKYKNGELTEEQYQEWMDYFPFSLIQFPEPYNAERDYDTLYGTVMGESMSYPYSESTDPVLKKHDDVKRFGDVSAEPESVDLTAVDITDVILQTTEITLLDKTDDSAPPSDEE